MIKSMTGFGQATIETEQFFVSVEIKSLNSKNLEVFVRMPRAFSEKEIEVRNVVSQQLDRGKINVSIDVTPKGSVKPRVLINRVLAQAYFKDACETMAATDELSDIAKVELYKWALTQPEAIMPLNEAEQQERNAGEWPLVAEAVQQALDACNKFRSDEGLTLKNKLEEYLRTIEKLLLEVEKHDPQRIAATRQRLMERVQELASTISIDNNRFEQELIYYIEKLDIAEEKVRLRSHLNYAIEALNIEGSGKKLGFIGQEIGREINTIGSKVNDAIIQRVVVQMKEELEKIKEQSLNIV